MLCLLSLHLFSLTLFNGVHRRHIWRRNPKWQVSVKKKNRIWKHNCSLMTPTDMLVFWLTDNWKKHLVGKSIVRITWRFCCCSQVLMVSSPITMPDTAQWMFQNLVVLHPQDARDRAVHLLHRHKVRGRVERWDVSRQRSHALSKWD